LVAVLFSSEEAIRPKTNFSLRFNFRLAIAKKHDVTEEHSDAELNLEVDFIRGYQKSLIWYRDTLLCHMEVPTKGD